MAKVEAYEKNLAELLYVINGNDGVTARGLNSYPNADDPNNQTIHTLCLELEKRGLIYRHNENDVSIVWMPTKQTDPQDRDDTRQREASLQQTIADLQAVLFNAAGLERLANISDEEWQRVEDEDTR